jgi:uncharacterized protein with PQ loop repeat
MPELSLNDIDRISRDIRREEITFSHLPEDLIDHVCCDVEYEMESGLSFNEAYNRVRKKLEPRRLKEIQEETLYAIDSKYRKMKTTMKITGMAGTVLFGFASLFKIQHWTGAGIMMTLGAIILAFVFMPSALGVLWKETHNGRKLFLFISSFFAATFLILGTLFKIQHWPAAGLILALAAFSGLFLLLPAIMAYLLADQERKNKNGAYITGALGIVFYICGMFFKIQHWPFATLLNTMGMILLCVIALPWYSWITWKDEKHISPKFFFLVISSLLIILPGTLLNLSLQYSYEDYYYPNLGKRQTLNNYLYSDVSSRVLSYHDSAAFPKIEQLHSKTTGLISLLGNIEVKMVQASEGEPGNPAISPEQIKQTENGPEIQFTKLTAAFDPSPVKDFLLPSSASRQELDNAIGEYVKFITTQVPVEETQRYLRLIATENYLPGNSQNERPVSMMSGLHSLEVLKGNILTSELHFINTIAKAR